MFCRLAQVDQNRISVHNEIKKSICSLILEINKKGKMLVNQLEVSTKAFKYIKHMTKQCYLPHMLLTCSF